MKRFLKIILALLIFTVSFICVDGICAKFLGTRPIISKKEKVIQGAAEIHSGYVYKSLFADVYYCDTVVEAYDTDGNSKLEEEIRRYYNGKGEEFVCDTYVTLKQNDDIKTVKVAKVISSLISVNNK